MKVLNWRPYLLSICRAFHAPISSKSSPSHTGQTEMGSESPLLEVHAGAKWRMQDLLPVLGYHQTEEVQQKSDLRTKTQLWCPLEALAMDGNIRKVSPCPEGAGNVATAGLCIQD